MEAVWKNKLDNKITNIRRRNLHRISVGMGIGMGVDRRAGRENPSAKITASSSTTTTTSKEKYKVREQRPKKRLHKHLNDYLYINKLIQLIDTSFVWPFFLFLLILQYYQFHRLSTF